MELNVGFSVSDKFAINIDHYFSIKQLLEDFDNNISSEFLDLKMLYDQRIPKTDWKQIFHKEFINLFQWATKRIIYANNSQLSPQSKVFVFLPYYGIILHSIRRVLPLILLNYEVHIIVSYNNEEEAKQKINYLLNYLEIDGYKILTKDEFIEIKEESGQLILFTGKKINLSLIREKYKKSHIIGATGECAICIFKEKKSTKFKPKQVLPSCTNIKYEFIFTEQSLSDGIRSKLPLNLIYEINPTVIYTDFEWREFPEYKKINLRNEEMDSVGICADPINGYYGDYKI